MPAATTHVEFAKDVLRTNAELKKTVHNLPMFYVGSQGPDILFFSHMSVMPGSLHKYGNLMHEEKVYEVLSYFEKYAEDDPDLQDYIKGYICHYSLDSCMHPLVYARTDYLCRKYNVPDGTTHVSMESEIDVWLLNQRGRKLEDYDVYEYLQINKKDRDKLAQMYHCMFREIYHLDISKTRISHGIAEVYIWTKFIRPRKSTYNIVYSGEKLIGNHFVTGMMLYDTKPGKIINLDHRSYTVPWQPHNTVRASVPELYGAAVLKASRLLTHHKQSDFLLDFKGEPNQTQNA